MENPLEVRHKPLFVLSNDRVILSDVGNALDVLWDKFEKVAREDKYFYDKRYHKKKHKWHKVVNEVASMAHE